MAWYSHVSSTIYLQIHWVQLSRIAYDCSLHYEKRYFTKRLNYFCQLDYQKFLLLSPTIRFIPKIGYKEAWLVEAPRHKPGGCRFDSQWGHWDF